MIMWSNGKVAIMTTLQEHNNRDTLVSFVEKQRCPFSILPFVYVCFFVDG